MCLQGRKRINETHIDRMLIVQRYEENILGREDQKKLGKTGLTSVLSLQHWFTLRKQQGLCKKQACLVNFEV